MAFPLRKEFFSRHPFAVYQEETINYRFKSFLISVEVEDSITHLFFNLKLEEKTVRHLKRQGISKTSHTTSMNFDNKNTSNKSCSSSMTCFITSLG